MNIQDIYTKLSPTGWGFFLAVLSTMAHADMNDCMKLSNLTEKNYCMATYSGSALFCDKIPVYERRQQCMRMVIQKQREATYSTRPKEEKKEQ